MENLQATVLDGISYFDVGPAGSGEDARAEEAVGKYIKGGFYHLDSKGRVILGSNQISPAEAIKINASLILGNPESGSGNLKSLTTTNNETGKYVAVRLDSSTGGSIDIDVEGSIINTSVKDIVSKAKRLIIISDDCEVTSKDKLTLSGKTLILSGGDSINLEAKTISLTSNELTIGALGGIKFLTHAMNIGKPFRDDLIPIDKQYDPVVTLSRLSLWYEKTIVPFIEEYKKNVKKYNKHTHSGTVPPPSGEEKMELTDSTDDALTMESLKASRTLRVI